MIALMMMVAATAAGPPPLPEMSRPSPVCSAIPAAPPSELAAWGRTTLLAAGAVADRAPRIALGAGVKAQLLPARRIAFPFAPPKPGDAAASGGLFSIAVPAPGRYRIALGGAAWIDMVRDGRAIASANHRHGPDCSGIRKMVDFELTPGIFVLQIAGSATPTLSLMIVRLP